MASGPFEARIEKFLRSPEPEILCIHGRWGVGKTYIWNDRINAAKQKNEFGLKRYAYVSLFGISSLSELKYLIYRNSESNEMIGVPLSISLARRHPWISIIKVIRRFSNFYDQLPIVRNILGDARQFLVLNIRKNIVCIDDIERRGRALPIREVLGLASYLKTEKACKVVFILNEEELLGEDKDEFEAYLDKVVDVSIFFDPTPESCATAVLNSSSPEISLIKEFCVKLGITNIRVIQKIIGHVREVGLTLHKFNPVVMYRAVKSITLFSWSIYEPKLAIELDYIKERHAWTKFENKAELTPKVGAWNALLSAYKFYALDDFDRVLLDGISRGYFDLAKVEMLAADQDAQAKAREEDVEFANAWRLYHDSFDPDANKPISAIYEAFKRGYKSINVINLHGTVVLFRDLGRGDLASEIIKLYVEGRNADRGFFDLDSHRWAGALNDPELVKAFADKLASFIDGRGLREILLSMKEGGWNDTDLGRLAGASPDEYFEVFKTLEGADLQHCISVCLQFDRFSNSSAQMVQISGAARDALSRIGKESQINARRVRSYGVIVAEGDIKSSPQDAPMKSRKRPPKKPPAQTPE